MLPSTLLFVILVYFVEFSVQCIGLGCAGFGGCGSACLFGLCLQTPIIQPMGCPCGIGFSCMRGGCVRRAAGAKTFQDEPIVEVQSDNAHYVERPDDHFKACCGMLDVAGQCSTMCSYSNFSIEMIEAPTFPTTLCTSKDIENIIFCAARGADHSPCCQMAHIPDYCSTFCDQSSMNDKSPSLSTHILCAPYFGKIWECFSESAKTEYYEGAEQNLQKMSN